MPKPITPTQVKTFDAAVARYGPIVKGKWLNEHKWMTIFKVPQTIAKALLNRATNKNTNYIYCNLDLVEPLLKSFNLIIANNLISELKTFDGCFCIRAVRGSTALSSHSYGLAIDINADDNKLGSTPLIPANLVRCFKDSGFSWGGDFKRLDGMHFSYCWE